MKTIISVLIFGIATLCYAQSDTVNQQPDYRVYPEGFPIKAYRFKPFLVGQSTLAGEIELFSNKRPNSFVFGAEATFQQTPSTEVAGGSIEIDRRAYLDRSIAESKETELMFYLSYGAKYGYYEYEYAYDYYSGYPDYINSTGTKRGSFSKINVNIKFGVQFLAFKRISIDSNIGAGIHYVSNPIKDKSNDYYYYDSYTLDAILRKGIQPTIHLAIGLAN